MKPPPLKAPRFLLQMLFFFFTGISFAEAQMITGVWRGKINRQKVEVKIIQNENVLTGTTYYYESPVNYRRYSIKGYFNPGTNEVVWWDDQLIESTDSLSSAGKGPLISRADFNCPGYGRMILGGGTSNINNMNEREGEVSLDKSDWSDFSDEWDFVLENFTVGANDPDVIDSVDQVSMPTNTAIARVEPLKPLDIGEKFVAREKVFATEIPVSGDSIELHFYDNAQVDGDSVSLFLNDKLIFEHIRLTDKAFVIKLAVSSLQLTNELIMVAENLGSIPPNTSYMVALVDGKRYDARLESTEGSSALIRLIK